MFCLPGRDWTILEIRAELRPPYCLHSVSLYAHTVSAELGPKDVPIHLPNHKFWVRL